MKKYFIVLSLILLLSLSACGEKEPILEQSTPLPDVTEPQPRESEMPEQIEKPEETAQPEEQSPEYETEPAYQAILELEKCTDPDELSLMLEELYGEEISYIKLDYKEDGEGDFNGYEEPYEKFMFFVGAMYKSELVKDPITSDSYAFFLPYHESPVFIMDVDGSYLVDKYEIENNEDGTYVHKVSSWSAAELYLCFHGYIGEESEKEGLAENVRGIEKYTAFEQLINEYVE